MNPDDAVTVERRMPMPMNNRLWFRDRLTVYMYIPKVACTSLRSFFVQMCEGKVLSPAQITDYPYTRLEIEQVKALKQRGVLVVGFVRNPWDRLVSCYRNKMLADDDAAYYAKQSGDDRDYVDGVFLSFRKFGTFKKGMTFGQFVHAVCEIPEAQADPHFQSQYCMLADETGALLPNFLGRFETLNADFNRLCTIYNVKADLSHLRPSGSKNYLSYYSPELIEKVGERYHTDIGLFGYTFDGCPETVDENAAAVR